MNLNVDLNYSRHFDPFKLTFKREKKKNQSKMYFKKIDN